MSVRRVVLSSLVLVALARTACVVAEDRSDKPVLGPAVPIGELELLILKAGFDDEPQPLPPASIPQLEPSLLHVPPQLVTTADLAAPDGLGMFRATARIAPGEEIRLHLTQAFMGLTAAGLTEEAERVGSILNEFETKHQPRLVLAAKQAQLNALQAEVERLKLRVEKGITADQVMVSVMIVEMDYDEARKLFTDDSRVARKGESQQQSALSKTFDKQAFQELKSLLQHKKGVRILSSPTLIVLSGQQGQVMSGGKLPTPGIAQAGGPKEMLFGTTVMATPTITDKDQVRLQLDIAHSELDEANGVTLNGTFVPGKSSRRIRSTLDLKEGQTTILGGLVSTRNEQTTETFVTVTVEIVQSDDGHSIPLAPLPIPTPSLK